MFWTYLLLALIGLSSLVTAVESQSPQSDGDCQSQGGLCIQSSVCPENQRSDIKGLCPSSGEEYECCFGVGTNETRCRKNGGECIPLQQRCPPNLVFSRATDCTPEQKCCILV